MKREMLKCGCVVLVCCIGVHAVVSRCQSDDGLCETRMASPHIELENPMKEEFVLSTSISASGGGPNVAVDFVRLAGDIRCQ